MTDRGSWSLERAGALSRLALDVAEARADWLDVDDEMETCAACEATEYGRCESHQMRDRETGARMDAATAAYRTARRAR